MYRVGRTVPYPSPFLIKALFERGGEVILSSDSHDCPSICYQFDEMAELLKSCGFRYAKTLTRSGLKDVAL
jgi:histidinol-phosphatase (PHP family)